jgi:hypothetical protein
MAKVTAIFHLDIEDHIIGSTDRERAAEEAMGLLLGIVAGFDKHRSEESEQAKERFQERIDRFLALDWDKLP